MLSVKFTNLGNKIICKFLTSSTRGAGFPATLMDHLSLVMLLILAKDKRLFCYIAELPGSKKLYAILKVKGKGKGKVNPRKGHESSGGVEI